MGRLIEVDVDELKELLNDIEIELTNNMTSIVRENYIPKADYENRLKADMVAMLTEIQLEIEEKEYLDGEEPINITQDYIDEVKSWEYGKKDCYKIIQQKINVLKSVHR